MVDQEDVELAALLLTNGVGCDFEKSDMPPYHGPKQQGCLIDNISYPVEFTPPLIRAVKIGNVELVRLLLATSRRRNDPKRRVFQDSHRPESRSHGEEIVTR